MQAVFSPMMRHLCRLFHKNAGPLSHPAPAGPPRVAQGIVLAAGIAAAAWRVGALSRSGALAATAVGTAVYAGTGVRGSIAVIGYFLTSSALGRIPGKRGVLQRRGNQRDAVQVLANGGPPALFALLNSWNSGPARERARSAFAGSLATAAADTWATEIGTRWGGTPRRLVGRQQMQPGDSGGVTAVGLAASAAGSLTISVASLLDEGDIRTRLLPWAIGGFAGSVVDSLLGETVQEVRWCDVCAERTEMLVHTCGRPTCHLSGLPGINNDIVNVLAVMSGGLFAAALAKTVSDLTARKASRVELPMTMTNSRSPGFPGSP